MCQSFALIGTVLAADPEMVFDRRLPLLTRGTDGFVKLTGFTPKSRQIVDGYSSQFQWLSFMEKYPKQPTISQLDNAPSPP